MKEKDKIILQGVFIFILMSLPLSLLAQNADTIPPVPVSDIFKQIAELVKNWKGLSSIGIAASIISLLIQMIKTEYLGGVFDKLHPFLKRALITILGQIAGILIAISGGLGWVDAIVAGLLTSGGAVAIYEAISPLFRKRV